MTSVATTDPEMAPTADVYLAWRPVGAIPVSNRITRSEEIHGSENLIKDLQRYGASDDLASRVEKILLVARLDGIFIFSIFYKRRAAESEPTSSQRTTLARVICRFIKARRLEHEGTFHDRKMLKPEDEVADFLNVEPVKVDADTCSLAGRSVDFSNREQVSYFLLHDAYLVKARAKPRDDSKTSELGALLRLREIYLAKRRECMRHVKDVKNRRPINLVVQFVWGSTLSAGIVYLCHKLINLSGWTSIFLGLLFFAVFFNIMSILTFRLRVIRWLRRTIGFLQVTETYSHLVDAIHTKGPTHGFKSYYASLQTYLDGETEILETQRQMVVLAAAVATLVVAVAAVPVGH